jgi:hypothetical protein
MELQENKQRTDCGAFHLFVQFFEFVLDAPLVRNHFSLTVAGNISELVASPNSQGPFCLFC